MPEALEGKTMKSVASANRKALASGASPRQAARAAEATRQRNLTVVAGRKKAGAAKAKQLAAKAKAKKGGLAKKSG